MSVLTIKGLHVAAKGKEILKGVNLTVNEGETLALLGPNGHGKSTLLGAIMGNPNFEVTEGSIELDGEDVLAMEVDQRSKAGLFLAMQNPPEIPGVNSADFYKAALNAHREKPMTLFEFYRALQNAYKEMETPFEMSNRNLNEGFSGGEKKRNEILQMKLLNPKFAFLDEIDSGLDVDAIQLVAKIINEEQAKGKSFLVISHYARLLNLLHPQRTAVMINGRIAFEGGYEVIEKIDSQGYEWLKSEHGIEIERDTPEISKTSIGVCATREVINESKKK